MTQEGSPQSKKEGQEHIFANVQTFDDLYEKLHEIGEVEGSGGEVYTAGQLIALIEGVRNSENDISTITRSHDLREVIRLLLNEESDRNADDLETALTAAQSTDDVITAIERCAEYGDAEKNELVTLIMTAKESPEKHGTPAFRSSVLNRQLPENVSRALVRIWRVEEGWATQ